MICIILQTTKIVFVLCYNSHRSPVLCLLYVSACGDDCAMSICYCDVVGGRPCGVCAEWKK